MDQAVTACVCNSLPYCCTDVWTAECAKKADDCGSCDGSCCSPSGNATPGCMTEDIEEALDRLDHAGQQSPGIAAASASFRACVKGMPWDRASAIWWIDTKRVLGFAYEAAYDILPGITPDSLPIDITRMPPAKTFLAHMNSLGGVGYSDKDGLVFQCRTIGFASALASAARIVDRAPGAAPWVLERMMDSFR